MDVWQCLMVYIWGIFKDSFLERWESWNAEVTNINEDLGWPHSFPSSLSIQAQPVNEGPYVWKSYCEELQPVSWLIRLGPWGKHRSIFIRGDKKRSIRGQSRETLRDPTWLWGWWWGMHRVLTGVIEDFHVIDSEGNH